MQAKVLLVDDDALSQWALDEALTDAGYRVLQAATGDHAGELMDKHPDLAILVTDISLAGPVTGLQLARFWRSRFNRPTVFITGFSHQDAGIVSLDARDAYLQKPFGAAELIRIVSRLLTAGEPSGMDGARRASWR